MSTLTPVKWNWRKQTTPETGGGLLSDISPAAGYSFSLSLIVRRILSKKIKSLCVLQCFSNSLDEAQCSDSPIQNL